MWGGGGTPASFLPPVEEKHRTVPVVPLFLEALRGKVAQLVQYGAFPLQNSDCLPFAAYRKSNPI